MATTKLSKAVSAFMKDEATVAQTRLVMDAFHSDEDEAIVTACSDAGVKFMKLVVAIESV